MALLTGQNRYVRQALPWVVPGLILAVWQILSQLGFMSTRILPAPTQVLEAAVKLIRSGEIFRHIAVSTARAAAGFVAGGSVGFVFGLLNGLSSVSARQLNSTLQMIRNIPQLALIPLCILWFGIYEGSKLFLVGLGVFFPIYLNTYHGIRTVDPGLIEMGRVYGLSAAREFLQTDIIVVGIIIYALLGKLADVSTAVLERRCLAWHPAFQGPA